MTRRTALLLIGCVMGFTLLGAWYLRTPSLLYAGVHITALNNGQTTTLPLPEVPAYELQAISDTLWALNERGVFRWDAPVWTQFYAPASPATDMAFAGDVLWVLTRDVLVQCDIIRTQTCTPATPMTDGLALAAQGDQVAAVSLGAELTWQDGSTGWQTAPLAALLPNFDARLIDYAPQLVFSADGSLTLKWSQMYERRDGIWRLVPAADGSARTVGFIARVNATLWVFDSQNVTVSNSANASSTQIYPLDALSLTINDRVYAMASDADTTYLATSRGLMQLTDDSRAFQSAPDASDASVTALAGDGRTLWVQVVQNNPYPWLQPIVSLLLALVLLIIGFRRLRAKRAVTTF